MRSWVRHGVAVMGVVAMGASLSGCVVAAIPLVMAAGAAGVAATGFVVYKSVQTASGGTVRIAFGSADSKSAAPPQVLPPAASVAVWPGGTRERKFAAVLEASGKFRVTSLGGDALPATAEERAHGYEDMCRKGRRIDMIFAAIDEGQSVKSNLLSFKRGALIDKLDLEGYGCAAHRVVWTDPMAVIIEAGGAPTPQAEVDAIAGQAWAERVLKARSEG
jgi:hypothetical protein